MGSLHPGLITCFDLEIDRPPFTLVSIVSDDALEQK